MASKLPIQQQTVVIIGSTVSNAGALIQFFAIQGVNLAVQVIGTNPSATLDTLKNGRDRVLVGCEDLANTEKFVTRVIEKFGIIHTLINVADLAFQKDTLFVQITDTQWEEHLSCHQKSRFKSLKPTWDLFRKENRGIIIHVAAAKSLKSGSLLESTATMSAYGLVQTLAKEGNKYNIRVNMVLVDETIDSGLPLIRELAQSSSTSNGSLFEATNKGFSCVRWERSQGAFLNPDSPSYTPMALLKQWSHVCDFSNLAYPDKANDFVFILEKTKKLPHCEELNDPISYNGKVVVITGAGGNLGASYSRFFGKLGANVLVNDFNRENAEKVVAEINNQGGKAVANCDSVVEAADSVVEAAICHFGRIDVLVNNAGFLQDQTFLKLTEDKWDAVMLVHLQGTYAMAKAAWPYFIRQGHGRIINTSSTSGIYGFFGQANYSSAKLGIVGITQALAREGAANNIHVYAIAPVAGSQDAMNRGWNLPPSLKADYNCPLVALLGSDRGPASTGDYIFEQGCGWVAATRQRRFPLPSGKMENSVQRALSRPDINRAKQNIAAAKVLQSRGVRYTYTPKDVILYNLSVGARRESLSLVYENAPEFRAVPTFGVIPGFQSIPLFGNQAPYSLDYLFPNISSIDLLHAEHYLEIAQYPIPRSGSMVTDIRLTDVVDKGKNAYAFFEMNTRNEKTGELVLYNEMAIFVRGGAGTGVSMELAATRRSSSMAAMNNPSGTRAPDLVVTERIPTEAAALYRLNADLHPIHIDPAVARHAGFQRPILHGLCTLGYVGRIVQERFGLYRKFNARFLSPVLPGQTLRVSFWREGTQRLWIQAIIAETGKACLGNTKAELVLPDESLSRL